MPVNDNKSWAALEYEYLMYFTAKGRLEENLADTVLHNAMVEAHLVHARILAGFLLAETQPTNWPDDIIRGGLLPAVESDLKIALDALRTPYGTYKLPNSLCWKINKLIVHFTEHRAGLDDHKDLLLGLECFLEPALKAFALQSKRTALTNWFETGVAPLSLAPGTTSTSGTISSSPAVIPLGGPII